MPEEIEEAVEVETQPVAPPNPDEQIHIRSTDPTVEATTTVPRWAYEALWFAKGWREFDPTDPEKVFPDPENPGVLDEETAQDAPDVENVGAEVPNADPPPEPEAKGGTKRTTGAASAADKE